MPGSIAEAIHTEMTQLPTGSSGQTVTVKDILTNISKGLKGERIAKEAFRNRSRNASCTLEGSITHGDKPRVEQLRRRQPHIKSFHSPGLLCS